MYPTAETMQSRVLASYRGRDYRLSTDYVLVASPRQQTPDDLAEHSAFVFGVPGFTNVAGYFERQIVEIWAVNLDDDYHVRDWRWQVMPTRRLDPDSSTGYCVSWGAASDMMFVKMIRATPMFITPEGTNRRGERLFRVPIDYRQLLGVSHVEKMDYAAEMFDALAALADADEADLSQEDCDEAMNGIRSLVGKIRGDA